MRTGVVPLAVVARAAVVKVAEKEAERGEVESAVGMVADGAQRLEDRMVAVVAAMAAAAEGASRAVARAGVLARHDKAEINARPGYQIWADITLIGRNGGFDLRGARRVVELEAGRIAPVHARRDWLRRGLYRAHAAAWSPMRVRETK